MNEPIFSVLNAKAQSCDSNGNCLWCGTLFKTPRVYGTITVTGAGSVTYTDPDDINNPWNGTFDINGTYTYDSNSYYGWGKPGGRLLFDFQYGQASIMLTLVPTADVNSWFGGVMPTPSGQFDGNYSLDYLWSVTSGYDGYDLQNSCSTRTIASSSYTMATPYYPGLTINGPAPTVTWNPNNANRTICNNAGGIYLGMYFSTYNGPYTATEEECAIMSQLVDGDPSYANSGYWGGDATSAGCSVASSPGGNYTFDSQGYLTGVGPMGYGCCSDETTCLAPYTDCTSDWQIVSSCP